MPIYLSNIFATSGDVYYSKEVFLFPDIYGKVGKGTKKHVDLRVGDGIKISFDNKEKEIRLRDGDYDIMFTSNYSESVLWLKIKDTWFQGAAIFDVEIKDNDVIITNTDRRLYFGRDDPCDKYRLYPRLMQGKVWLDIEGYNY